VVVLGAVCLDECWVVETFPSADVKVRALDTYNVLGGNAWNVAYTVQKLSYWDGMGEDIEVVLVTTVGQDGAGDLIRTESGRMGITLAEKTIVTTPRTNIIVSRDTEDRCCIHKRGEQEVEAPDVVPLLGKRAGLEGVTLVVLDSRHPGAALCLANMARQQSIPVALDLEKKREAYLAMLASAQIVHVSSHFVQQIMEGKTDLSGVEGLLEGAKAICTGVNDKFVASLGGIVAHLPSSWLYVVCTFGSRGSYFVANYPPFTVVHIPAYPPSEAIPPGDAIGTGDVFLAAAMHSLLRSPGGFPTRITSSADVAAVEAALTVASRVAGIKTRCHGARLCDNVATLVREAMR